MLRSTPVFGSLVTTRLSLVGVAVAIVVKKERKPGQVDVVAGEDDLLARRGVDDLGLDPALAEFDHATAGFALIAAESPCRLFLVGVRVGQELELAVGDLLDQHGGQRIGLHDGGQLVDALLLLDADEQARLLHLVDEIALGSAAAWPSFQSNVAAAEPVST